MFISFRDHKVVPVFEFPQLDSNITASCFSPNGRYLVLGTETGRVVWWHVKNDVKDDVITHACEFSKHTSAVKSLSFAPSSQQMVSCADFTLRLWQVQGSSITNAGVYFSPYNVAVFKNEKSIIAGGMTNKLHTLTF